MCSLYTFTWYHVPMNVIGIINKKINRDIIFKYKVKIFGSMRKAIYIKKYYKRRRNSTYRSFYKFKTLVSPKYSNIKIFTFFLNVGYKMITHLSGHITEI